MTVLPRSGCTKMNSFVQDIVKSVFAMQRAMEVEFFFSYVVSESSYGGENIEKFTF